MTNYQRITGKVFGSAATATGDDPEIGQFGSALAGTYNGTTDVATIQSLPAWQNGFISAVTPTEQFPPLPEMTGFGKVLSHQICYLLQQGIAEWDSGTTYYTGNWCSSNGSLYISKADENLNNPVTNTTYWTKFTGGSSRNLGEYVTSSLPLTDTTLHLADGSLLNSSDYPELIEYISELYPSYISTDFSPAFQSPQLATQSNWQSITYGDGIFLAKSGTYLSSSTDGIAWNTPYQINIAGFSYADYVVCNGSDFFAIGGSGSVSVFTSSDGENWTAVQTSDLDAMSAKDAIFDGTNIIILDSTLTSVWISSDGTNWEQKQNGSLYGVEHIAFDGSKYVVTSASGYICISTDLANWTVNQPVGITGAFMANMTLGYDGSRFFGVYNGQISYSIDGINWTTPVADTNLGNQNWKASINTPDKTVIISSNGYVSVKGTPVGIFTTEAEWQQINTTYGECGKYVYNAGAGTVRIPSVSSYFKNTVSTSDLGDLTPASIPNVKGTFSGVGQAFHSPAWPATLTGDFYRVNTTNNPVDGASIQTGNAENDDVFGLDASRTSSVYSDSATTVNTQSIKQLVYIVVKK